MYMYFSTPIPSSQYYLISDKMRHQDHNSTRDNSTTMAPIDNVIAAIEVREAGGKVLLREYANCFGVHRSTLGQRWRRMTVSQEEGYGKLLAVSSQQELELVQYIEDITKQGLPPTSDMVRDFAPEVALKELGSSWVARFVKRHEIHLISN
jgi:hypothetical protein